MKQNSEIDGILREVARRRDRQLGAAPTLSPARQAALAKCLAVEFALGATFHQVAVKRDRSLRPSGIPSSVEKALQTQLTAKRGVCRRGSRIWPGLIRSPLAAVLSACVMIAAAILFFGTHGKPARPSARIAPQSLRQEASLDFGRAGNRFVLGRAELFSRTALVQAFDLNKAGPASLQASFFTNSAMYFANGDEALPRLRLDLPVRASFKEETFIGTP